MINHTIRHIPLDIDKQDMDGQQITGEGTNRGGGFHLDEPVTRPVAPSAAVPVNGDGEATPEASRISPDEARTLKQLAQQAFGYAAGERRRRPISAALRAVGSGLYKSNDSLAITSPSASRKKRVPLSPNVAFKPGGQSASTVSVGSAI
jgi:hypothetical protein